MNKGKIAFAIGSLDIGGAEKQMLDLISSLKERDFSCHLFTLESKGPLLTHMTDLGIPIHSGNLKKGDLSRAPWKLLGAQRKLIRMIRQVKPRVVHAYLPLVSFMAALAGTIMHVPLVITSRRALGTHQERFRILRPFDLLANLLSHRVTVNSMAIRNDTIRLDHANPVKLVLIYNGIDADPFETALPARERFRKEMGVRASERIVTVIANLIPYKGHIDFLKSARLVADEHSGAHFWLVGEDRGIQKDLERLARDLRIRDRVAFMGQRDRVPEILAASELSVLPSHEEGFSNVLLESMATGKPGVATHVGGNPEAVVDGVTGWLVPPENPELMAEKIIDPLQSP